MTIIKRLKSKIRSASLYKPVLHQKARWQERNYIALRDAYQRENGDFFSPPGYLERSRELLRRRFDRTLAVRNSIGEVRLFVADTPGREGPWFESELERNFDAVTFSVSRHMRRFDAGARDLVVECIGVDPHDRLYPGSQRVKGSHSLWFSRIQKDLLEAIGKANDERSIDLVFIYGGYGQIAPETLRSIRSLGIPIAILSLDDKHSFLGNRRGGPYGREGLVNSYDVHLTNSLECVRWYVSEGVPAFYFPQGIDPELCEPVDGPRDIEVSFVGQAYGFRLRFIKSLRRAGIPVQCFGRGWENGTVEDQFDLYRRSRINLGIGATGLMERMTCIKARDFEVPASGTLYITTYDHELANLFIIGKEILCYRNDVDCVELLRFYLQNPEEAEHIACAGRARCLAAHTWTHRMVSVLKWMGILVS